MPSPLLRALPLLLVPLLVPLLWLVGLVLAAATLLVDLLCTPWVTFARLRPRAADRAPASRNASIVVLNWNGLHFLRELLPSLQVAVGRCPGDHEVIVVDNGSDDGSADWCGKEHPWVRVVRLPRNLFFIRGNAAGAAAASRDILVFLNNDMRVEPDFLVELLAPFGPPDLFAVTARIEMTGAAVETGCTRGEYKRGELRFLQVESRGGELVPALWAGGGSSAFDRCKYLELGGFDALYDPFYVEDVSLSYAAWKRGWRVLYSHRSVVHHVHRGTSAKAFGRRYVERIDRRNRELFWWRNITAPGMVLARALLRPWIMLKLARQTDALLQCDALLRSLRRWPAAVWARQRARVLQRRRDGEVLVIANHTAAHRRALGVARTDAATVVLSIGPQPSPPSTGERHAVVHVQLVLGRSLTAPVEDLFGLLPRRCWASARNGRARDAALHALREVDYDVVWLADLDSYVAAAPALRGPAIVQLDGYVPSADRLERRREQRLLAAMTAQVSAVVCRDAATATAVAPLLGRAPEVIGGDAATVGRLVARVLGHQS